MIRRILLIKKLCRLFKLVERSTTPLFNATLSGRITGNSTAPPRRRTVGVRRRVRRPTPLVFDQQWLSSYDGKPRCDQPIVASRSEITAWTLWIEDIYEDAALGLITKRPRTVARVAPARRSLRPPFVACRSRIVVSDVTRTPVCPRYPQASSLRTSTALSNPRSALTQPTTTKRYRPVNQPIPEVADDSRLQGDNALNAIGPAVHFSRTNTSPLEGSPASKAESTPDRSPSPSPTAASIAVCRRQLRLRRTGLVLRRHQVRTRGVACLFVLILRYKHGFKNHHTGDLRLRIQLRSGSLPSCRNRSVPTD